VLGIVLIFISIPQVNVVYAVAGLAIFVAASANSGSARATLAVRAARRARTADAAAVG